MTLAIYAITSGTRVRRLTGMRGEPLRGVTVGRLTALVSDVRRSPAATSANLRRYHDALTDIARRLPALLPARFGTVMDEGELAFILRSRAAAFSAALRAVRGRVQMNMRIPTPAGHRHARPATAPNSSVTDRHSGAAYLRSRAAEAARERNVPELAALRDAITRWVRDERVERRDAIVSVYHLVPRASAAAYTRAATRAAAHAGIHALISGPFPPYAFTTL